MSGAFIAEHIDAVDAFARTLFVRAKQSPTSALSADVALAVHQLHIALRHLRVEAADPDSLLNADEPSSYSQELSPLVKDAELALKHLETVLDQYGATEDPSVDGMADQVIATRSKLQHEKAVIDRFLDRVQLESAAKINPSAAADSNQPGLEVIKDKVDVIARRLFSRRDNDTTGDEHEIWQEFKSELEKEGFSSKILDEHKDILRAYIRELESMSTMNGGAPPTVRGLLECEALSPRVGLKDMSDFDQPSPVMQTEEVMPDQSPPLGLIHQLSYDHRSWPSDENSGETEYSLAMISTRDLMTMDALNVSMAGLHIQSPIQGIPPFQADQRFLTSEMAGTLHPPETELSKSANSQIGAPHLLAHPQPPYYTGGPYAYGSSAPSAYGFGPPMHRLAPDSYGREIPMDAQWTRIRRTLVSPEVLHRAGVRYEARPEYVAILGCLSREQIAHFAQLSAECRAARMGKPPPYRREANKRERRDSKSSRDDDDDTDGESGHETDATGPDDDKNSEKGTKSYPFIVSPPEKNKTSPASTVLPKPILKNKNTNHVRFDPEPHEVSPREKEDREWQREHNSSRRNRDRDDRDRDDHGRHRDEGRRRRDSGSDRHRRDDDYYRSSRSDRDRRDDRREPRSTKRRAWGETLGVVGIGGAAASLLGVLAEAAVGI